jgi:hypothetical protein
MATNYRLKITVSWYVTLLWYVGTGVSSLDVEVACSSEAFTAIYHNTQHHIPENSNLHSCYHENLMQLIAYSQIQYYHLEEHTLEYCLCLLFIAKKQQNKIK